jgi:hypothetical protein
MDSVCLSVCPLFSVLYPFYPLYGLRASRCFLRQPSAELFRLNFSLSLLLFSSLPQHSVNTRHHGLNASLSRSLLLRNLPGPAGQKTPLSAGPAAPDTGRKDIRARAPAASSLPTSPAFRASGRGPDGRAAQQPPASDRAAGRVRDGVSAGGRRGVTRNGLEGRWI